MPQRPKLESCDTHLFAVTRTARASTEGQLELEQLGLFMGQGWVPTFQESHGDTWRPLRQRLSAARG